MFQGQVKFYTEGDFPQDDSQGCQYENDYVQASTPAMPGTVILKQTCKLSFSSV